MAAVSATNPAFTQQAAHAQRRSVSEADALGPDPQLVAEMKHEINALVQEVTLLAGQDISPDAFYSGFLTRIVSAMAAAGGAVWLPGDNGTWKLQYQINLGQTGTEATPRSRSRHGQLIRGIAASGQAQIVPPSSGSDNENGAGNPTDLLLIVAPFVLEEETQGVVEIFQRPGGAPSAQRGYLRFLAQMADLACAFIKSRRLRQLEETQQLWRQLEGLLTAINHGLDLRQTAYAIVNEGRRLIGCDRLTLAVCYGNYCRIEAVSGLDTLDRRASELQGLARVATAVVRTGEPIWSDGSEDFPPQIQVPLQAYIDRAHTRLVGVLPLVSLPGTAAATDGGGGGKAATPIGAIIVEQFREADATETIRMRSQAVAKHSAQSLANSLEHSSLFLLPLWKALGQITWLFRGSGLVKTVLTLGIIGSVVAALIAVPTNFEIQARGKLQPSLRAEIFAPLDGLVSSVLVEHGQIVEPGAVLAQLTNTDLDIQLAAVLGRQTTNRERLEAIERVLLDNRGAAARLSAVEENRLSGEMLQLHLEAQNIERELALLHDKQRQLTVVANERGQVVTWKVRDLLLKRPVARGQGLMTLANPDGPWELELYLPERRLTHLQRAQRDASGVEATFILSSHPGQTFRGIVAEIEQTAEVRGDEGNTVLVRVAVDKETLPQLHDQTTVTAKLNCGRTSVGYAWFCDLIETVQSKVLFWLPS
jgi:multidrug efflux pump subunit AcrA (membrane-fusion protein)